MKWKDVRPGDMFVSFDSVGLSDPAAWIGRAYLVVAAGRGPAGSRWIRVLGPGGDVCPDWEGEGESPYYADELVGRMGA